MTLATQTLSLFLSLSLSFSFFLSSLSEIRIIDGLFLNVSWVFWSYNFKSLEIIFCVSVCVWCMYKHIHTFRDNIKRDREGEREIQRTRYSENRDVWLCLCVCWVLYNTNICISPVSLAIYLHFIQKFIEPWHMWNVHISWEFRILYRILGT
jgi:hypothetical protein